MMTARQLREALRDVPDNAPVVLEGCDCANAAAAVTVISAHRWGRNKPAHDLVYVRIDPDEDVVS